MLMYSLNLYHITHARITNIILVAEPVLMFVSSSSYARLKLTYQLNAIKIDITVPRINPSAMLDFVMKYHAKNISIKIAKYITKCLKKALNTVT